MNSTQKLVYEYKSLVVQPVNEENPGSKKNVILYVRGQRHRLDEATKMQHETRYMVLLATRQRGRNGATRDKRKTIACNALAVAVGKLDSELQLGPLSGQAAFQVPE